MYSIPRQSHQMQRNSFFLVRTRLVTDPTNSAGADLPPLRLVFIVVHTFFITNYNYLRNSVTIMYFLLWLLSRAKQFFFFLRLSSTINFQDIHRLKLNIRFMRFEALTIVFWQKSSSEAINKHWRWNISILINDLLKLLKMNFNVAARAWFIFNVKIFSFKLSKPNFDYIKRTLMSRLSHTFLWH